MKNAIYEAVLFHILLLNEKKFYKIIDYFNDSENALLNINQWKDVKITVKNKEYQIFLDKIVDFLNNKNNFLINKQSEKYPKLLKEISSTPPILFIKGDVSLIQKQQIAIVGSRNATQLRLQTAFYFARNLTANGLFVTSGLAKGIDSASHKGALEISTTIAVVGTGVDVCYPRCNINLYNQILDKNGVIISELILGSQPHASHFPRRNRIISGLSCSLLLIEAAIKSGSLISARFAIEHNRDVFAIPGSIYNPLTKGPHSLIKDGAYLAEDAQDILNQLNNWNNTFQSTKEYVNLNKIENTILDFLKNKDATAEEIAVTLKKPIFEILSQLTDLELDGFVESKRPFWGIKLYDR